MSAPPLRPPPTPVTGRLVRLAGGRVSLRVGPRSVAVGAVSLLVVVVGAVASLTTGEAPLTVFEVGETLVGQGSRSTEFVVLTLRLPRLLLAIGVGAALAVSGAVLQSISRNVLGSPDVIGFTTGAATGALIAIVVLGASTLGTSVGALIGGVVTALVVVGLAAGRGTQGLRLVLIGIGVGAMLLAVNSWLITRAALQTAVDAQAWLLGDLSNRGWTQVVALAVALVLLLPIVLVGARRLAPARARRPPGERPGRRRHPHPQRRAARRGRARRRRDRRGRADPVPRARRTPDRPAAQPVGDAGPRTVGAARGGDARGERPRRDPPLRARPAARGRRHRPARWPLPHRAAGPHVAGEHHVTALQGAS